MDRLIHLQRETVNRWRRELRECQTARGKATAARILRQALENLQKLGAMEADK